MGLAARGGKLLMRLGRLLSACACCTRYWCIPAGLDSCGNMTYSECQNTQNPPPGALGPYSEPTCGDCLDNVPECPQDKYYCCYESAPTSSNPKPRKQCQKGPCDEALIAGGPYRTQEECAASCTRYDCTAGGCYSESDGEYETLADCQQHCNPKFECSASLGCVGSTAGQYASLAECQAACGCDADPAPACPPQDVMFGGEVGFSSKQFAVPAEVRLVTVTFDAADVPDRFQILGPTLDGNGNVVASRVMKRDSGWRGNPGYCKEPDGPPTGTLVWEKGLGITCFEVAVLAPCPATAWGYKVRCEVPSGEVNTAP